MEQSGSSNAARSRTETRLTLRGVSGRELAAEAGRDPLSDGTLSSERVSIRLMGGRLRSSTCAVICMSSSPRHGVCQATSSHSSTPRLRAHVEHARRQRAAIRWSGNWVEVVQGAARSRPPAPVHVDAVGDAHLLLAVGRQQQLGCHVAQRAHGDVGCGTTQTKRAGERHSRCGMSDSCGNDMRPSVAPLPHLCAASWRPAPWPGQSRTAWPRPAS